MKRSLKALVADIADGVSVDWRKVEDSPSGSDLAEQFRVIAAVGASGTEPRPEVLPFFGFTETIVRVACAVAAAKLLVAASVAFTTLPLRIGPQFLLASLLAVAAVVLFGGTEGERRARALASLFLLLSATFVTGYLQRATGSVLADLAWTLRAVAPEAFLPLALWQFAAVFPGEPRSRHTRQVALLGLAVATAVGAAMLIGQWLAMLPGNPGGMARVFNRELPASAYWPVVCLTAMPAPCLLVWKARWGTIDERHRVTFLAASLAFALSPSLFIVTATPWFPALALPPLRDRIGVVVFLSLALTVPAAAYAVLVQRVLKLDLLVRSALKHALARRVVWSAIAASLGYVGISLYRGRHQTLGELIGGNAPLVVVAVAGLMALTFRVQILAAVDRWFARGPLDYAEVMSRLAARMAGLRDMRDLHDALERELTGTLGAERVSVLVLNERGSEFTSIDGSAPALHASSALVDLARAFRDGLPVGEMGEPRARLLPPEEQRWLSEVRAAWLFPMLSSSEQLLGLVCLGRHATSQYVPQELVLVSAMADQVALRMENLALRHRHRENERDGLRADEGSLDWHNERGAHCRVCGTVCERDAAACECGGALEPAALPVSLNGKFRVEKVLGVGGMSIVYRAHDLTLNRKVALKAMPQVTPRHTERLRREAKAMASVLHPNLAMIHSVEGWRDRPVLVMEYLDGGTLMEALKAGPLAVDDALELGIVLADALDRLHSSGWLHRDIKPSNIGYTSKGVPRLLDFGLAAVLDAVRATAVATHVTAAGPVTTAGGWHAEGWSPIATGTHSHQLAGTPLYLSPEALEGQEPSPSFDLWSLGVVLYEATAGQHPFAGYPTTEVLRRVRSVRVPDVRDFRPDTPPALAAFLNDSLSLTPERRCHSAAAFRVSLQTLRASVVS